MSDFITARRGERIVLSEYPAGFVAKLHEKLDAIVAEEAAEAALLESLDFAVPCAIRTAEVILGIPMPVSKLCPNAASYVIACRWCKKTDVCCTEHGLALQRMPHVMCTACGKTAAGIVMFDLSPLARS